MRKRISGEFLSGSSGGSACAGNPVLKESDCRILVVDDSVQTLEVIRRNLEAVGFHIITATGVEEAVEALSSSPADLLITDLKMPKGSGLDLLRYVRENLPDMEIMIITGYPCINGAVQAIKDGAEEYLVKPFTDEELLAAVRKTLQKLLRRRAVEKTPVNASNHGLIGASEKMKKVFSLIDKASTIQATVLISGESGTGKELVARAVHYASARRSAPFVAVNCAAVPDSLLESELFGHVKGAFTGATESRAGFLQIADKGTIFLDEIGDASLNMQGKLLRFLQNREICMVGSPRVQKVDTRIIAATHKDLRSLVAKNLFREDFFYRLNILEIEVPPLNERGDDIFLLLGHFSEKFAREMHRDIPEFTDEALRILRNYVWHGNVRELENLVQRLMVMVDGPVIDIPDLPEFMRFHIPKNSGSLISLAEAEEEHIRRVLSACDSNKTKAARILGIDRKTLREKLKE